MTEAFIVGGCVLGLILLLIRHVLLLTVSHVFILVILMVFDHGAFLPESLGFFVALVDDLLQVDVSTRVGNGHWILVQATTSWLLRSLLMLLDLLHQVVMEFLLPSLEV